jgi:phosphoribosyl-AMP cyclohydrolase
VKLTPPQAKNIVKSLRFKRGLVTALTRDHKTKETLMVAFQNREAVLKTLTEGVMYYWSRSRRKLWLKGEESGHKQLLRGVRIDCDGDALLYDVKQIGGACHKGYFSCFHLEVRGGKIAVRAKPVFKPEEVYK